MTYTDRYKLTAAARVLDDMGWAGAANTNREAVAELQRRESPESPDIELPNNAFEGDGVPLGFVVNVAGRTLKLVNWVDFRGWEVRLHEQLANTEDPPRVLGYLSSVLAAGSDDRERYGVRTAHGYVPLSKGGFERIDEALEQLVKWRA